MGHKLTKDFAIKQIKDKKYDSTKRVSVTDSWYPNYPNNQIEVSIYIFINEDNKAQVIISAYGMDDDYLVLRSEIMSPVSAIHHYNTWKEFVFDKIPDNCNHQWFFEHSFYYD